MTIGLGNSNSAGDFDLDDGPSEEVATDLFIIRKVHFTASLESQLASEDETQKKATSIGQRSPALPEPDQLPDLKIFWRWTLGRYQRIRAASSLGNYYRVLGIPILDTTGRALHESEKREILNVRYVSTGI